MSLMPYCINCTAIASQWDVNRQEHEPSIGDPKILRSPLLHTNTYKFSGKISRNRVFQREIPQGLLFQLTPLPEGWEIWIGDRSKTGHDFSALATPPFRGINSRHIEGWHFRNIDNSGANEIGDKNVNAPQRERHFCFFLKESDYQTAYQGINKQLLPSEEDKEDVVSRYSLLKAKTGALRINHLELGNLEVGRQAWIEYMEFEVELDLSKDCPLN